jgi:hypothetical protein
MTEIETIRLIGVVIFVVCVSLIGVLALVGKRVDEETDDETDDEMCCEPDYSYDLGRYVHTGLKCRNADYEYLKAERG